MSLRLIIDLFFPFADLAGSGDEDINIVSVSSSSSQIFPSSIVTLTIPPSNSSSLSSRSNYVWRSSDSLFTTGSTTTIVTHMSSQSSLLTRQTVNSFVMITPDLSPSSSANFGQEGNIDYLTIYLCSSLAAIVVLAILALVLTVTVVKMRLQRRKFCCTWYKPKPSVVQPQPLPDRHRNNGLPTRVMLIYSTETKEKKLLEILVFLDDGLGSLHDENGRKLFEICKYDMSVERDHPSEWLDKNYRNCDHVVCIVGKKFKKEWEDEVRPDMPLVYAFHQLFNASFTSSTNPLNKIVIVLRNKSKDEKHIPSQYLQGRQRFGIDDTDGLASYMLGRPRHVFLSDSPV